MQLAAAAGAATQFRMLNSGLPVDIGYEIDEPIAEKQKFLGYLTELQGGGTPLCRHITEVVHEVNKRTIFPLFGWSRCLFHLQVHFIVIGNRFA